MENNTQASASNAQQFAINPYLPYVVLGIIAIVASAFMAVFGNNLG